LRAAADADLVQAIVDLLPHIANGVALAEKLTPSTQAKLLAAMPGLKERAKTLVELIDGAHFILAERPIPLEDKAAALLTPEARILLRTLHEQLSSVDPWMAENTEQAVRLFAERQGVKLGAVAQPLRAALTGRTTSPGIFDVLDVLGKQESLARLTDQGQ
jgi:glutamyl-tRNA synthetase